MDPTPSSQVKIPSQWEKTPDHSTRTELLFNRRRNNIPHSSFDLDNDGAVGAHDLVLASRFDLDKDGVLNSQERANALKAIKNGFSQEFVWGCESSGLNRSFRIVQKRGKVIMDEDFGKIRETYPKQATGDRSFTKSELEDIRKKEFKEESKRNEQRLNTVTQIVLPMESFLCKDAHMKTPQYSTVSERKNSEKLQARVKAGLTRTPQDLKDSVVDFQYQEKPLNISFTDMRTTRRGNLIEKLNQSVDFSHKTFYEKIENERQYVGGNGKVLRDSVLERKTKDVNHYQNTFGLRASGIHGRELPKFEDNLKLTRLIQEEPRPESLGGPVYQWKEYHKIEPKSDAITAKPTEVVHKLAETEEKNRINSKWTSYYMNFMPKTVRDQEIYQEQMKLIRNNVGDKKQFRFLSSNEITPPITQRLLQNNYSPNSKFKSITSTGFSIRSA